MRSSLFLGVMQPWCVVTHLSRAIGYPETSVTNQKSALRNIAEERRRPFCCTHNRTNILSISYSDLSLLWPDLPLRAVYMLSFSLFFLYVLCLEESAVAVLSLPNYRALLSTIFMFSLHCVRWKHQAAGLLLLSINSVCQGWQLYSAVFLTTQRQK